MDRVVGVDVARAVAVLGMFAAHVGAADERFWTSTGWLAVADGRSAATFAVLAGVSAALLTRGREGPWLRHARVRLLVRCVLLWLLGAALIGLDTPVVVILPAYAVMLALVVPLLRVPAWVLLPAAAAVAVTGSFVVRLVRETGAGPLPQPVDVLVGEHYPAVVWFAYVLVGVVVGRTDLAAPRTATRLATTGAAAAVVGYGTAAVALRVLPADAWTARALLTAEPHADTVPEVVGNTGAALLLLAAALAAGRRVPRLVAPLAATGALALTAYSGQLVAIAALGDDVVWSPSNAVLLTFVVVTVLAATLWRATLGRGPLERAVHGLSVLGARVLAPLPDRARAPVA